MPIDPVCGAQIDEDEAVASKFRGDVYYFCCDDCKEEFLEAPEEFVGDEVGTQSGEDY